ncbi:hypothetical protein DFJ74DRAFT_768964 [Hyaloraphidium curvatum]|nr:hypothetical protein DFJ74DRAFT_768964 [Hyaloraphidium curvatum]
MLSSVAAPPAVHTRTPSAVSSAGSAASASLKARVENAWHILAAKAKLLSRKRPPAAARPAGPPSRSPLAEQPVELTLQLLEYLGPVELCRLGATCRAFKNLVEASDSLWAAHCSKRWALKRHLDPAPSLPPFLDYSTVAHRLSDRELAGVLLGRGLPLPALLACTDHPLLSFSPSDPPLPASPEGRTKLLDLLATTTPHRASEPRISLLRAAAPRTPDLSNCGKWHAAYVLAELDSLRQRATEAELRAYEWSYRMRGFEDPEPRGGPGAGWSDGPPDADEVDGVLARLVEEEAEEPTVRFLRDGTRVRSPRSAMRFGWPRERRWRMDPRGGLQVGSFPSHRCRRTEDWGFEFSNGWVTYASAVSNPRLAARMEELRGERPAWGDAESW